MDKGVDFLCTTVVGEQMEVQAKTTRDTQSAYIYKSSITPGLVLVAIRLRDGKEPEFYVTKDLTDSNSALVPGESSGRGYYWIKPESAGS